MKTKSDIVIIGGGIVGLSLAYQIVNRKITSNITVIDKEKNLGMHTSGRNSGVLHSGIYYPSNSLKAKVCKSGSERLKSWIKERNLSINECGKIILPTNKDLDYQLDVLHERGINNGSKVEIIDNKKIQMIIPECKSITNRAIWSPNTAVVKPSEIINSLKSELENKGVKFMLGEKINNILSSKNQIQLNNGKVLSFSYMINASGTSALRIAKYFEVGLNYRLIPFKGLYWQLKKDCPFKPRCNLYPVPDLKLPFLGVHFTPSADKIPTISIGPTATLAFGKENYYGLDKIEPINSVANISTLLKQYLFDKGGFKKYFHEQALLSLLPFMINSARKLIPSIELKHVEISKKVGIRAQLFDIDESKLENDFVCISKDKSIHILNAISPAFTSSFALADEIINNYVLNIK